MENGGKGEDKRTGPYHQLANLSSLQTLRFPLSLLCFSWKLPLIFPRNSPRLPNSIYKPTLCFSSPKILPIKQEFGSGVGAHNCMTSASELFSRRSRLGRAAPPADFEGLELPDDRNFHYISNRRRHHHRHDPDGCDPLRRAQHFRHISHRVYRSVSLGFIFGLCLYCCVFLFLLKFLGLLLFLFMNQAQIIKFLLHVRISGGIKQDKILNLVINVSQKLSIDPFSVWPFLCYLNNQLPTLIFVYFDYIHQSAWKSFICVWYSNNFISV